MRESIGKDEGPLPRVITEVPVNPEVDEYFDGGCGRCELVKTPKCKVNFWREELALLRAIVLDCGLVEKLKWRAPVYMSSGKNIAMIAAFKDNCVLSFFKGVLLQDSCGILEKPGGNSQSARVVRFRDIRKVFELESVLRDYLSEAVEVEKSGKKIRLKTAAEHDVPEELRSKFIENPQLERAFDALTPGRQRGYYLHFSAPKNSKTRVERIDRCISKILNGKGFQER